MFQPAPVNVARFLEIDPEDALRSTINKFTERFRHIERRAQEQGLRLSQMSLEQMDSLWDEAKAAESRSE